MSGGQGGALVVDGRGWGAVPDHRGLDDCDGLALKLVVDFQLADDRLLTGVEVRRRRMQGRQHKLLEDLVLDEIFDVLQVFGIRWERNLDAVLVLHHALLVHNVAVFQQHLPPVGDQMQRRSLERLELLRGDLEEVKEQHQLM